MTGAISFALGVVGACIAVCAPCVSRAGPFDVVDQLDVKLVRGQSTAKEVRRLLGKPDGKGDARFPPAWVLQEIWLYEEEVAHANMWNPEIRDGKIEADTEVRSLYVLFTDGRFDGYYWYGMRVQGEDLP
jgi:hypothetical protein